MIDSDLIIRAEYLALMDEACSVIKDGAVAVKNGLIQEVGEEESISGRYASARIIGGPGYAAFPGLVNSHCHSPMVYFRGMADDIPLKSWLEDHIWPAENRWLSPEFVADASELACLEMIKAGITLFSDMYFYGDSIASTVKKCGLRAVVAAGVLDFPSRTANTPEEYLENADIFINKWKGDDRIVPGVAPHSPYTCSPETLRRAKALADRYGLLLQVHVAETEWEKAEIQSRYKTTPVEHLAKCGVLDEKTLAAHCVHVSERDIDLLAERGTSTAHCIKSNLKLASGIAPVVKMLAAGARISLGTDGAASNNDIDIIDEMSTAARIHKAVSGDPTALDSEKAVLMATRWGAESLGQGHITGSLETGKSADVVLADIKKAHLAPIYDIRSHMVYSMKASDVDTVVAAGKVLMESRKPCFIDEAAVLEKARRWGLKIASSQ